MVKSGQVVADAIVCKDGTGALATPSVGPVGVLYVNGVANAATVIITGANPYKFSVTLPSLSPGDLVSMYITATIAGVATADFVWRDVGDTSFVSDVATDMGKMSSDDIATKVQDIYDAVTSKTGEVPVALEEIKDAIDESPQLWGVIRPR